MKTDSAAGENVNASNGRATNFLNGLTDSCVRERKNKDVGSRSSSVFACDS